MANMQEEEEELAAAVPHDKRGMLMKRGRGRKIGFVRPWANRYFSLSIEDWALSYYAAKNDENPDKLKGSLSIAGCTVRVLDPNEAGKAYSFELQAEDPLFSGHGTVVMAAASEDDMWEWVSALQIAGKVGKEEAKARADAKLREAVESLRKQVADNPNSAKAQFKLGVMTYKLGQLDDATNAFRAANSANANHSATLTNLGNSLTKNNQAAAAIEFYQASLTQAPDDPDTLTALGVAHFKQGNLLDAIENFRASLRLRPNHSGALKILAIALGRHGEEREAAGQKADAITFYRQAAGAHQEAGNTSGVKAAEAAVERCEEEG